MNGCKTHYKDLAGKPLDLQQRHPIINTLRRFQESRIAVNIPQSYMKMKRDVNPATSNAERNSD
jgi:hypothetical protein